MLFDIYFILLKVLAVPNFHTRQDTLYFSILGCSVLFRRSHHNPIFFIEGIASAICLKSLSQLAYLSIACTENDRPPQQNLAASTTNHRSAAGASHLPQPLQAPKYKAFSACERRFADTCQAALRYSLSFQTRK
jgi:hypothetical protein